MQLYGYQRETNPKLSRIKDELVIFDNVLSPHCYTTGSLLKSLTLRDWEDDTPNQIPATFNGYCKDGWIQNILAIKPAYFRGT